MSDSHGTHSPSDGERFRRSADAALSGAYEAPVDLTAYIEAAIERPSIAAHASRYLLAAIESAGTRTVIEEGEQIERYRFFDDPYNDGEHAIQGHTRVLNRLVDDLQSIAAGRGKDEKILWIAGPTATGKSELKRCLINGLRAYSKTEEGRRYTLEWNIATAGDSGGMSYGDPTRVVPVREDDWYTSPVQVHPLLVFPEEVRNELVAEINDASDDHIDIRVDGKLDPFSQEAYDMLVSHYNRRGVDDLFSKITASRHLRVVNYIVDIGNGIGVLHAEDVGSPKHRLVGSWMQGMLRVLNSRGRKNPQAFSYDGVLSQGNGVMTVVEDASQHADLLQKLLTVPDEARIKLDTGIELTVDTQLIIISNPDLVALLDQHADAGGADPLKALKRRLEKYEFGYLTNVSLEAELLRRELTNETTVLTAPSYPIIEERIREPVTIPIRNTDGTVVDRELAPHTIEAAAMFAVLSRLDASDVPADMDIVDKALLYDRGYHDAGDRRLEIDDFDIDGSADGTHGIPVTYTRDVIAELIQSARDRRHPELPVEHVLMPDDVIDRMVTDFADTPLFSDSERVEYEDLVSYASRYILEQQEADVLSAIMFDQRIDEETLETYVEHVYAWGSDETLTDERGEEHRSDPLRMKIVEIEHLGRFDESDYDDTHPGEAVEQFRKEHIITALNRHAWERRDQDYTVDDVTITEIPTIAKLLEQSTWADVERRFEDLESDQWADPPTGTETAAVKADTIDVMVDQMGYSFASAELTSRQVMNAKNRWSYER